MKIPIKIFATEKIQSSILPISVTNEQTRIKIDTEGEKPTHVRKKNFTRGWYIV